MLDFTRQTQTNTAPTLQRSGARILDIAEGVLVGLRRCSVEDSFAELVEVARRHALSPFAVADALVTAAARNSSARCTNPDAVVVIEQEWGELLRQMSRADQWATKKPGVGDPDGMTGSDPPKIAATGHRNANTLALCRWDPSQPGRTSAM